MWEREGGGMTPSPPPLCAQAQAPVALLVLARRKEAKELLTCS